MSCEFAHLDAAYVLGSLAPAERADYERHLKSCDECSRAVREFAGLPGLLARVPADVLEPLDREPVPPTLLPALVAAAQKQQRRRTIRTALLAAAAVAVIAGGTAITAAALEDDDRPEAGPPAIVETTAAPQQMTPVGRGRSTGWVSLTPLAWGGTRLDLTCEYQSSYSGHGAYKYKLVVYTKDGLTLDAASFSAKQGEEVLVDGEVTAATDQIDKVVVENSYGEAILLLTP